MADPGGPRSEDPRTQPHRVPATTTCPGCGRDVGPDWRFCKACGAHVSREQPARAGERQDDRAAASGHALVEVLASGQPSRHAFPLDRARTVVGRADGDLVLGDDETVSARHAALELDGDEVRLSDLGSTNGTFVSLSGTHALADGDVILAGTQRLLYRRDGRRSEIVQVLPQGRRGRHVHVGDGPVTIGRGDADLRFPDDAHLSALHAEVRREGGSDVLRDLGSTNRTFVVLRGPRVLQPGDRIVLGRRVYEYRRS